MKTISLLLLMNVFLSAFPQVEEIPKKIETAFKSKYPDVTNYDWNYKGEVYNIEFYKNSSMFTCVIREDGNWIETAEVISDSDAPELLKNYIKKNYPSGAISYTEIVESAKNGNFFRVNLDNNNGESFVVRSDKDGKNIVVTKAEE